MVKLNN